MRNWDYRFCWLRDATLTLLAMLNAGYRDEARAWRAWLRRAVAGDPADLQIMYGIAGERRLDERELEWLPGYERLAAGAGRQRRLGAAPARRLRRGDRRRLPGALSTAVEPHDDRAGRSRRKLLEWLEDGWREKDAGIWEMRGPAAALHPLEGDGLGRVRSRRAPARRVRREGPVERWRALRDEIHAEVLARAWSDEKQAFAQSYGADELDASVLLMPLVGFLPATDERVRRRRSRRSGAS